MQRNAYGFSIETELTAGEAETKLRQLLQREGFDVVTRVDLRKIMKAKLGIRFRDYRIIGACDPTLAQRALEVEPSIGLVLPFNVVLEARPSHGTSVSFVDPLVLIAIVGNPALREVAADASIRLTRVARFLPRRSRPESEAAVTSPAPAG
jgi:uncharacterized protein (DUF302 family)